jgi:hypothetical protein
LLEIPRAQTQEKASIGFLFDIADLRRFSSYSFRSGIQILYLEDLMLQMKRGGGNIDANMDDLK